MTDLNLHEWPANRCRDCGNYLTYDGRCPMDAKPAVERRFRYQIYLVVLVTTIATLLVYAL